MKDGILIIVMIILGVCGFGLVYRLDGYFSGKRRRVIARKRKNRYQIRLAGEREEVIRAITSSMEYYREANPHVRFEISQGMNFRLASKLQRGRLDVVVLTEESFERLHWNKEYFKFPTRKEGTEGEGQWLYVLWNPDEVSKKRDRFLFVLKNDYQRLQSGYRNY